MFLMAFLSAFPDITLFFLWCVCVGALHPIRQRQEGMSYNNAYSSLIGDTALIFLISAAVHAVREQPTVEFEVWEHATTVSLAIAALFVVYFMIVEFQKKGSIIGESGEAYHTFVIVPLLAFLVSESFYVFTALGNETDYVIPYWIWGVILFLVWVCTYFYDVRTGRLDQQKWLKANIGDWMIRNMRPSEILASIPYSVRKELNRDR